MAGVLGPYRVLDTLGRGGMGVVYRAQHQQSGEEVALKTVLVPRSQPLQSLRREIHALARVRHPGIVRIVGHGLENGVPWYAMELLQGRTLRHWVGTPQSVATQSIAVSTWWTEALGPETPESILALPEGGASPGRSPAAADRFPPGPGLREKLRILRKLCAPLAYLHGEGIVHRDLKPDNVLIRNAASGDPEPVLADFGLVSGFSGERGRESLQIEGDISGTVAYMAPEQLEGEIVDARADLYALGCILYELVTGQPPFVGETPLHVLRAHLKQVPDLLSVRVENVPPALDDLVARLLAKEPRLRWGYADDVASALAEIETVQLTSQSQGHSYLYRPRIAGRGPFLDRLLEHLDRAELGQGALVLLGGESGMGKTRLGLELVRQAIQRSLVVLTGQCIEAGGAPLEALRNPFQVVADRWTEIPLLEATPEQGRACRLLAHYEPAFAAVPAFTLADEPAVLPPEAARQRLYRTLNEILASLAEPHQATLLVLDDLQWADELVLGWIRALAQARVPLLLLGTYRSEEVGTGLQDLLRQPGLDLIRLGRLESPAVAEMIEDMLALDESPQGFSRLLARHAEGNPFFVTEYLRTAVGEGLLRRNRQGRWDLAQEALQAQRVDLPLPSSLRDLVRRRLEGLQPEALRLVEAAAVLGAQGLPESLQRIAGLEEKDAFSAQAELLRRQVLEEDGIWLRFVHDKFREVAYEGIDGPRKIRFHRLAAEGLEAGLEPGENLAALAHHWEQAAEPTRARIHYLAAARQAVQGHALADAERFYRAVLRLFPAPEPEAIQARNELGLDVLQVRGRVLESLVEHGVALAEAVSLEDVPGQIASLRALGQANRALQRLDEAELRLQEALRLAQGQGEEALVATILGMLARLDHDRGRGEEARAQWLQVLQLARRFGARELESKTLGNLAILSNQQRRLEEAEDLHRQALVLAREMGDRELESSMLENLALIDQKRGRLEAALPLFQQALEIVHETGNRGREGVIRNSIASVLHQQGQLEEAQTQYQQCIAIGREIGHRLLEAYASFNLADLSLNAGDLETALTLQNRALQLGIESQDRRFQAACWLTKARSERLLSRAEAADSLAEAQALFQQVPDPVSEGFLHCEQGHLALQAGRAAGLTLERAVAVVTALQLTPQSELAQAVARLERAQAQFEAGQPLFRGEVFWDIPEGLRNRLAGA